VRRSVSGPSRALGAAVYVTETALDLNGVNIDAATARPRVAMNPRVLTPTSPDAAIYSERMGPARRANTGSSGKTLAYTLVGLGVAIGGGYLIYRALT